MNYFIKMNYMYKFNYLFCYTFSPYRKWGYEEQAFRKCFNNNRDICTANFDI